MMFAASVFAFTVRCSGVGGRMGLTMRCVTMSCYGMAAYSC